MIGIVTLKDGKVWGLDVEEMERVLISFATLKWLPVAWWKTRHDGRRERGGPQRAQRKTGQESMWVEHKRVKCGVKALLIRGIDACPNGRGWMGLSLVRSRKNPMSDEAAV